MRLTLSPLSFGTGCIEQTVARDDASERLPAHAAPPDLRGALPAERLVGGRVLVLVEAA